MARLDHDWLLKAMANCRPSLPEPFDLAAPTDLQPEDESVLRAFYGSEKRFERARAEYRLVRAITQHLACDLEFARIWRGLICTEWLAHLRLEGHINQGFYRDHIFHPAAVAMLGWELLHADPDVLREPATATLEGQLAKAYHLDPAQNQTWTAVLEHAWLVAGLFHDHGCPSETLAKCAADIKDQNPFFSVDVLQPFRQKARELWKANCLDQQTLAHLRPQLKDSKHCHAALSALALYSLKSDAPNDFARAVLDVAGDAVMWHHSVKNYHWQRARHFQFADHPVRYLLVLCDGLHEFCREMAIRREQNDGEFVTSFRESCTHAELDLSGVELGIEYHVNCTAPACAGDGRWKLARFANGLRKVQKFLNRCGPLRINCRINHTDCVTCPVGNGVACTCGPDLCDHG